MSVIARRVDLEKVAFGQGSSLAFSLVGSFNLAATDINRGQLRQLFGCGFKRLENQKS